MKFTIFKKTSEIHFDHNGMDDYDGDNGYYDEIEISDMQVHSDIEDIIIGSYFIAYLTQAKHEVLKKILHSLLNDIDCYDKAIETYYEELRCKYEREYNNAD